MSNHSEPISVDSNEINPKDEHDKRCAPGISFESGSCIRLKMLINLAQAYNIDYPNQSIKLYPNYEMLNPHKYKKYLLKELGTRLDGAAQRKWAEFQFTEKLGKLEQAELEKHTFRPEGPSGKFEWLNTLHIDDVLEQYEKKYPDFKYLGTVPMDFDDYERFGIKNLNYADLVKDGKTKYGVVFNLDNHNEPGSHWVAMHADVKKGAIYYFDSYGVEPEPRVRKLMRRIGRFCQTGMGLKNLILDYNKTQHQRENSECGVYSINFIIRMTKGENFDDVCKNVVKDKTINKCRNIYFGNTKV